MLTNQDHPARHLVAHDHACLFHESPDERRRAVAAFTRAVLDDRARLIYIATDRPPGEVLEELEASGVAVAERAAGGQIEVRSAEEAYLASGVFGPERMIEALRAEAAAATADGWSGLRVVGEMGWAARSGDTRSLVRYEELVDAVFVAADAAALCLYEERRFPSELCDDVAYVHPLVLGAEHEHPVEPWGLFRIERGNDGALRLCGEVDRSNADAIFASLRAETRRRNQLRLDLSDLAFLDARSAARLCDLVADAQPGVEVTHGVRSQIVRRVVELIRHPAAPLICGRAA